ncbi:MAG: AraC family transcriptional regulator [Gammaproteobacteria bacterium]
MDRFIRSYVLTGILPLIRRLGGNPAGLLNLSGISEAEILDSDARISGPRVADLLENCARALKQPFFGLEFAKVRNRVHAAGVVGAIGHTSRTLGEALGILARYYPLVDQCSTWHLDVHRGVAYLFRKELLPANTPARQMALLEIGSACRSIGGLLGESWAPASVTFVHDDDARAAVYRRFFRAPVTFNSQYNGLSFPAVCLDARMPKSDDVVHEMLFARMLKELGNTSEDIAEITRTLVAQNIGDPSLAVDVIAGRLGLHPRTLLRRLKRRGTTFKELLATVRLQAAERYLETSTLSITQIAEIVGYSQVSAFSRAFAGRYRIPPTAFRERATARSPE